MLCNRVRVVVLEGIILTGMILAGWASWIFPGSAGAILPGGAGLLWAAEVAPAPVPQPIAACEVIVPQGDYALVVLDFSIPNAPPAYQRWTYMGGMRAGRMRVDDGIGLREPGGWLELKNGRLTGAFRRNNSLSTSSTHLVWTPPSEITVDAVVRDGEISGTARIADAQGTVAGRVIPEAELAKRNAIAKDKGWPNAHGPVGGGCAAELTGAATIDSPAELRQVWRCEESDIGQGLGSITRFMHQWKSASGRRTASGANSPIVAEGRVYLSYYIPAPREPGAPELPNPTYQGTEKTLGAAMLQEAKAAGYPDEQLPGYALEKIYQSADDVVLCMDAATGKTLWKAVIKGRGMNVQHHKAGPFDMSPAYGDGKVFALGMSGYLYALDAVSGKPLWEVRAVPSQMNLHRDGSASLLVSEGVVIAPADNAWAGYDAQTGQLLWKCGSRSVSTLSRWATGGREYIIGRIGPANPDAALVCLEPRTGKELWRMPANIITGGRGLGPGGITVFQDILLVYQDKGKVEKGPPERPVIASYRLTTKGPEPLWEVSGGVHSESIPVVVRGKYVFSADLRVIDLATGKVLSQTEGLKPANGGYLQAIEDLVLVRTDGTHGGIRCGFYKVAADGGVRVLNTEEWRPRLGGSTTSYHHPIYYPMVDGRMFLRQQDGVYCWDARAKAGEGSRGNSAE